VDTFFDFLTTKKDSQVAHEATTFLADLNSELEARLAIRRELRRQREEQEKLELEEQL
jgi:hypothetical protein